MCDVILNLRKVEDDDLGENALLLCIILFEERDIGKGRLPFYADCRGFARLSGELGRHERHVAE